MIVKTAAEILGRGVGAIATDITSEKSKVAEIFKKIALHPVKVLALFIAAPILIFKIAIVVNNSPAPRSHIELMGTKHPEKQAE